MINFAKIIENDDLESFKRHFSLKDWKETVTTIANYAGVSEFSKEITYNDADCIKYALHCNSDKIFNYLLPLVDTDKHGDNYGWPLLAMAIKNQRYDYANQIVNHPSFNPYPIYHNNVFLYIKKSPQEKEHIDFLFNYLNKFDRWDFKNDKLIYSFTHLICHNEDTFERFNHVYKTKIGSPSSSVLDIYKDKMELLGKEVFNRKFNKFIIEKLRTEDLEKIIECSLRDNIYFIKLFESENAKEGLKYLLQCPDSLRKIFDEQKILLSYLPLDCILLLTGNGIDIWKEDFNGINSLDYILNKGEAEDETVSYFINQYPQEILDRLESKGRNKDIQKYCQQVLLENQLPKNNNKKIQSKI